MFIQAFPSGPFSTNAYLIACPHTKQAAIIDPAPDSAEKIQQTIKQHEFVPIAILLTHSHWDHIADVSTLKQQYNIPVYIHSLDVPNLVQPGSDGLPCWVKINSVQPDRLIKEADIIPVGEIKFKVIETPGHSPGSICLYNKEEGILFSGDTLFQGTIGNLSFPTSVPDQMWTSLEKLSKIDAQTKVYPGHGPQTTIGAETWLGNAKEIFG